MVASDWISLIVMLVTAASFVWGINAWRASYLGQKKIALAEEIYELTLRCIDHVRAIRDPVGLLGEGSSRRPADHELPEHKQLADQAYVAIERYEARKEDFFKLYSLMPRFSFYFGPAARKPVDRLRTVIGDIRYASQRLGLLWRQNYSRFRSAEEEKKHQAKVAKAEAIFWATGDNDDPIRPQIEEILRDVEKTCRRAIDPRLNLWWAMKGGLSRIEDFFRVPPDIREKDHPGA